MPTRSRAKNMGPGDDNFTPSAMIAIGIPAITSARRVKTGFQNDVADRLRGHNVNIQPGLFILIDQLLEVLL